MKLWKVRLIKTALLIAEIILIISCSKGTLGNDARNSLINRGLNGNIKFLIETEYKADYVTGVIQKGEIISRNIELFNVNGNILEWEIYFSNATLIDELCYKYDSFEKLIEITNTNSRTTFNYDSKENKVEECIFSQDGILRERHYITYNKKKEKIEEMRLDSNNTLLSRYNIKYDTKGREIENTSHNANGNLEFKNTSKYDEKGRIIEKVHLKVVQKSIIKDFYHYDEKGHIERIDNFIGKTKKSSLNYYDYDVLGNWQYMLQTTPPMSIIEREIDYY
jgi:hypothetical protein